jgi:hypothetical protein
VRPARVHAGERKQKIGAALALTDLIGVAGQAIGTLSHGYRQRVGVAQAIVHRPALVILDEPTRGLDPRQIVEMRKLIHELKDKHTVLLSSHVLSEVSQTCDRLLVLGGGQILGTGTETELAATMEPTFAIELTVGIPTDRRDRPAAEQLTAALAELTVTLSAVPAEHDHTLTVTVTSKRDLRAAVSRAVVGAGLDLLRLDAATLGLENTFLRMVAPTPARPRTTDMRAMLSIFRREFAAYTRSIVGWIVAAIALLAMGIVFQAFSTKSSLASEMISQFFWGASGVVMIISVILSFRTIAEDRQSGSRWSCCRPRRCARCRSSSASTSRRWRS